MTRMLQACVALILALVGALAGAPVAAQAWLTTDEQAWLRAHPVIRVGADPDFAPYTFVDAQGRANGVAADYLAHLGPMLGVRFESVNLANWAAVVQASKARQIDMISALVKNAQREQWLAFTGIVIPTPLVVISRQELRRLAHIDELLGKRVALVRGYGASQRVVDRLPGLQVMWVDSALAGLAAVAAGEADAYVGVFGTSLYLIHQHSLANLKPNIGFDLLSHGQRFGVRRDWAVLAGILDKALARMPQADRLAIQARWMPAVGGGRPPSAAREPLWTTRQRAWLQDAAPVRVALPAALAPFAFAGPQGQASGMSVDLLTTVAARTGLVFQPVLAADPDEALAWLRERRVDMALALDAGGAAAARALPGGQFYDSSYLALCRVDEDCLTALDAGEAMRVAVQAGSAGAGHAKRLPALELVVTQGLGQAIDQLAAGRVAAVLGESRLLLRALEQADPVQRAAVQLGGVPEAADMSLHMVVRQDWPELAGVFDLALNHLGDRGLSELRARWTGVAPDRAERALRERLQRVLQATMGAGAVVLAGVIWLGWTNRRLRAEVRLRELAERRASDERQRAEAASEHKSEFVAHTSHELRTPLNAIVGTQHLLEDSPLDGRQQRLLDIQRKAAQSLLELVDDLLDLARMETGQVALRQAPFSLRGLLDDSLAIVREAARGKQLGLALEADDGLPQRLIGDGQRLQQVLVNLLANAIKYTPEGSVTLQVRRAGEPDGRIAFAVVDTGPGIDAAQQAMVFEPFKRGNAAAGTEGTGLGLPIARHLVERMGGELRLSSQPGQGCRFHFELDLARALPGQRDPAEAAPSGVPDAGVPSEPARAPGAGLRVLLVEDNEVNRLIATEVLRQRGCEVRVAETGQAALAAMAAEAPPDIVLLDVGLPDIDGMDVVRHIRAMDPPRSRVPVLGLTARALLRERELCLEAGMDDVVNKPYVPDELWRCMHAVVARARSSRDQGVGA